MSKEKHYNFQDNNTTKKHESIDKSFNIASDNNKSNKDFKIEDIMLIKQERDEFECKNNEIKKMLEELEKKNNEYVDLIKRQQAEFENYKKRMIKEKEHYLKYASIPLISDFLNFIDNFDHALKVDSVDAGQMQSFIDGFKMMRSQFFSILQKYDVQEIETVKKEFDPNIHEAIMIEENKKFKDNIILEELQKGYLLRDKVIRSAKVKVGKSTITKNENNKKKQKK